MEAIVLAGGLGSRLRAEVPDVPKPMAPVNGRPFLEYLLDYWIGQGVSRFVLSVGYKREAIERRFAACYRNAEIDYAVEQRPLGTGGGLLLALGRRRQNDMFLVVNGDTFFEVDLTALRQHHEATRAEFTVALREIEANERYSGVQMGADGKIGAFSRARTPGRARINGGVYLAESTAFAGMELGSDRPVSLEDDLFPRMLAAGRRLYGFVSPGRFIDIGVPQDYRRAAVLLADR